MNHIVQSSAEASIGEETVQSLANARPAQSLARGKRAVDAAIVRALGLAGTLTATAWSPPDAMSEEEWSDAGRRLSAVESGVSWWIGDWWRFGERKFRSGKTVVESDDWHGPAYQTCANAASVCRSVPSSRRRELLSFAHHEAVAALAPEQGDAFLDWCEETVVETGKPRPVRELRNRVREVRRNGVIAAMDWPKDRYPLIYADPPWRYEHPSTTSREIENHYPTMDLAAICALPIRDLAADDAILFMWATNPKLNEAFAVLDAWGFGYRTNLVWVKDKIGMGYYARSQHELLLIARRGEIPPPAESERVSSVIRADRTAHSVKPEQIYGLIEKLYPSLPRIELFARQARPGWDAWGNQVLPVAQPAA